ncbi:LpqB family beta-propeller domain-containing protein [Sphaerisporangium perillae]|uniref:LpqB family beta-propeller domain-containing protein n=1 Tax=Sphaerisporangium perillae TaxID=2935860 RepID=UPI00200F64B7|nr:LpqB family beta-propeller domain-containing protein [Sphaerisporangium perillae]
MATKGAYRGLAVVLAALVSAACSTVPTGGNVFSARGGRGGDALSQPYVRILASPPKPQGSPLEIVTGFLAAAASFDDPLRTVARQYLTGEAQRTWSPFDAVTVYEGIAGTDTPRVDIQQAHVALKGTVLGTLDGDGHYVPSDAQAGSDMNKGFTLVKVSGEWRISSAPSGLLLSEDDFKRAYRSFDLYFVAYQRAGLVTDQVRVPINPSEGLAKSLVHRLLVGPTTPLRGAVESAFGPNVDVNNVQVENDTVVVDFTYGVVDSVLTQGNREALSAQLSWTLKPLTESRRIEVRVNGEQFPGGPFIIDPRDYDRFDPDVLSQPQAYYLQQGKVRTVDKERDNPPVAGVGAVQARQFSHMAVSGDQAFKVAALEKAGGVYVSGINPGSEWQRWIDGAKLTPPSWDRYGDVWSVSQQGPRKAQVLRAHDATRQVPVSAPGLESTDVKAFRVARDGARVAVISDDGHGQRVLVGSINRSDWRIQNLRTLVPANDGQEITDIAWQDASTLLVLMKTKADRDLSAWSVTQGVRVDALKAVAGIETVTAGPDPSLVLAGTADGEILAWNPQKSQWTTLVKSGADPPVYPLG